MTMAIRFLDIDQVIYIHADLIRRYGGSSGIHDRKLIESAIAQPLASFGGQFLHPTLAEMAAAYLFHLASNHGFADGNKRIGAATSIAFLRLNGSDLLATEEELVDLTLRVASHQMAKDQVMEFFRSRVK